MQEVSIISVGERAMQNAAKIKAYQFSPHRSRRLDEWRDCRTCSRLPYTERHITKAVKAGMLCSETPSQHGGIDPNAADWLVTDASARVGSLRYSPATVARNMAARTDNFCKRSHAKIELGMSE